MTAFDKAWALLKGDFRRQDRRTCSYCNEVYMRPEGVFGSSNWGYCPECTPKVMQNMAEAGQSEQDVLDALVQAEQRYLQTESGRNNPNRDSNVCNGCGDVFVRGDNAFGNQRLTGCRKCVDKVAHKAHLPSHNWLYPKEGEPTGPVDDFGEQLEGME